MLCKGAVMETITIQSNTSIDEKITEIIDRVLTQVFGKEATQLIYRHLKRNYSLKRGEVAEKIDVFAKGLEDFLNSGAFVIERRIFEDICSTHGLLRKTGLKETYEESDFANQVNFLKNRALES